MSGSLRVDRVYPHPPEHVWRALTDAELLGRWLMPNDFEPRVGHAFTFETDPGPGFDGIVRCEVLELDEPRRMKWSWRGGPLDTTVTFTLEQTRDDDDASATRLVVHHEGFRGIKSRLVQVILGIGNRTLYGRKLPAVLDELNGITPPDSPAACMSPWQRVLIFLSSLFPTRRRGPTRP